MADDQAVDVEGLYRDLDMKRRGLELSWREAAEKIGVSASTLTRMAQGNHPDVEGFAKMVRWLGVQAGDYIGGKKAMPKKQPEDFLVVVSRHLRASKDLDPKSAEALENIIAAAYKQMKDLKGS